MAILLRSQQIPCKLDPHFAAIAFTEDEQWLVMCGMLIQELPAPQPCTWAAACIHAQELQLSDHGYLRKLVRSCAIMLLFRAKDALGSTYENPVPTGLSTNSRFACLAHVLSLGLQLRL